MVKNNTRDKTIEGNYCNSSNELKYKGVRKRKWGKWVSEIRLPNSRERIWLGSYDSAEKAARAFDAAMFCLRGESANFNFPDNPPEIPGGRTMSRDEIQAAAAKFANSEKTGEIEQSSTERSGLDSRVESPSRSLVSDETMAHFDESELKLDTAFLDLLVNTNMGSDDFGFPGYDDIFAATETPFLDFEEENPNAVLGRDSFLWNF